MTKYFLLILLFVAAACTSGSGDAIAATVLDGTWTGEIMTVTIDFDAGTYEGVGLGKQFSHKLTLLEDNGDSIVFSIGDKEIVAQIVDDDTITLTTRDAAGNSGIPVRLTREK